MKMQQPLCNINNNIQRSAFIGIIIIIIVVISSDGQLTETF